MIFNTIASFVESWWKLLPKSHLFLKNYSRHFQHTLQFWACCYFSCHFILFQTTTTAKQARLWVQAGHTDYGCLSHLVPPHATQHSPWLLRTLFSQIPVQHMKGSTKETSFFAVFFIFQLTTGFTPIRFETEYSICSRLEGTLHLYYKSLQK